MRKLSFRYVQFSKVTQIIVEGCEIKSQEVWLSSHPFSIGSEIKLGVRNLCNCWVMCEVRWKIKEAQIRQNWGGMEKGAEQWKVTVSSRKSVHIMQVITARVFVKFLWGWEGLYPAQLFFLQVTRTSQLFNLLLHSGFPLIHFHGLLLSLLFLIYDILHSI